jgi:hypothetical protein
MADESAKPPGPREITPKDLEKLNAWLAQHSQLVGPMICPACRQSRWQAGGHVVELRPFHGGSMVLGGPVYPMVFLMCQTCGHMVFFNAIITGVMEQGEKKDGK